MAGELNSSSTGSNSGDRSAVQANQLSVRWEAGLDRLAEIVEKSPLYTWEKIELDEGIRYMKVGVPTFVAKCEKCGADRSFSGGLNWSPKGDAADESVPGRTCTLLSVCLHCHDFSRAYILHFDRRGDRVMKAGQYPPWDIRIDKRMSKVLGEDEEIFRKGFVCESQGYGIGAFAYYRRIVENVIDELLQSVDALLEGDDRDKYVAALAGAKTTRQADEKIKLVKDLLPVSLTPDGYNPLGVLYTALSQGIHELSDVQCLRKAASIRAVLTFLVHQVHVFWFSGNVTFGLAG